MGKLIIQTDRRSDEPAHQVAHVVDLIGEAGFFDSVVQYLGNAIAHEYCLALLLRPNSAPTVLYDGLSPLGYQLGLKNFLRKTYRINPFITACSTGVQAGFHRMAAFSQEHNPQDGNIPKVTEICHDTNEELGFVTEGWPRGMQELLLAIPLDNGEMVEFSLSQKRQASSEETQVAEWFQQNVPVLISTVRKHCQIAFGVPLQDQTNSRTWHNKAGQFDSLSEREMDVVNLVLAGYSSEAIRMKLDIALSTVKSHRRNIYHKLGVSSQAELFALATRRVWQDIHLSNVGHF